MGFPFIKNKTSKLSIAASEESPLGTSEEDVEVDEEDFYDNDLRNMEIVFDDHGEDPFETLRLQQYDDSPMPKGDDEVVVRIEAATVSLADIKIRNGTFSWKFGQKPAFPIGSGTDCFGTVLSCGKAAMRNGVNPGDRVGALALHGCNAKYRTFSYRDVVKAPGEIDACEGVCVIRTYGAAFQALMQGRTGHSRYARKPLNGKKILVVGPCGTFERAVVELALILGARKIYFASTQPHDNYIRLLGAKPLQGEPEDWIESIEGKIDIAIDSVCQDRYEHSYAALNEKGILVGTGMMDVMKNGEDIITAIDKAWTHASIALNSQCTYYHGIIDSWLEDKELCTKDLIFLFNLLENGSIRPKIASRIPLSKVPIAQDKLECNYLSVERRGHIIVEPWRIPETDNASE